jgi:hypothetical protein
MAMYSTCLIKYSATKVSLDILTEITTFNLILNGLSIWTNHRHVLLITEENISETSKPTLFLFRVHIIISKQASASRLLRPLALPKQVALQSVLQCRSSFPNSLAMARPGSSCFTRDSPTNTYSNMRTSVSSVQPRMGACKLRKCDQ